MSLFRPCSTLSIVFEGDLPEQRRIHTWVYLHLIEQFLGRDWCVVFVSVLCRDQEERQCLPCPIVQSQIPPPQISGPSLTPRPHWFWNTLQQKHLPPLAGAGFGEHLRGNKSRCCICAVVQITTVGHVWILTYPIPGLSYCHLSSAVLLKA